MKGKINQCAAHLKGKRIQLCIMILLNSGSVVQTLRGRRRLTGQKKTHYKYFKNPETYRTCYKLVVRVICCHTVPLSDVMQRKLVQWLHSHGERRAALWYEKYWTGDRGNRCKAHGGVGGTNNNNGTEGRWGGAKKFICGNSCSTLSPQQVILLITNCAYTLPKLCLKFCLNSA